VRKSVARLVGQEREKGCGDKERRPDVVLEWDDKLKKQGGSRKETQLQKSEWPVKRELPPETMIRKRSWSKVFIL